MMKAPLVLSQWQAVLLYFSWNGKKEKQETARNIKMIENKALPVPRNRNCVPGCSAA